MSLNECPQCYKTLNPPLATGRQVCRYCGWADQPKKSELSGVPADALLAPDIASNLIPGEPETPVTATSKEPKPRSIIKNYRGTQNTALKNFEYDAASMAEAGYHPTSQSWAEGSYSSATYLLAAIFILFCGFGLLILFYLVIVKPAGTLSVTYILSEDSQTNHSLDYTAETAMDRGKICPMCAESVKAAARLCRYCGHSFELQEPVD
ncbi:MAG: zinc ribbon domain-containing protein [Thermosynechococcaceae cyanobacterium]